MKRFYLSLSLFLLAVAVIAAGTNTVTVRFDLSPEQSEQLKFLRRYYGSTNALKDFATNVVVGVVWSGEARAVLQQRQDRIWQVTGTNADDVISALEGAANLPPLTNSVVLP